MVKNNALDNKIAIRVKVTEWMKAHVEGMCSFIYYVSSLFDRKACTDDQEKIEYYHGLIDLLTPVIKFYCSDRGFWDTNIPRSLIKQRLPR
jgi:hypothetical protein